MGTKKRKKNKLCLVCGNEFQGTAGRLTCSNACRTEMYRLLKAGKKPEFYFVAKGKGQKVPDISLEARLKRIKTVEAKPKDYDTLQIPVAEIKDEPLKVEVPKKELSDLEKLEWNEKIQREITKWKNKQMPAGMHPKSWGLQKDTAIKELENQIL